MQLLVSVPWWFILICLLCGFAYAFILYNTVLNQLSKKIMALLRFTAVSLLCFLLMGPVIVKFNTEELKPKILMVIDNSESIKANKDSAYYANEFATMWRSAAEELGTDYDIEFLCFGNRVKVNDSFRFDEKRSDISKVFDHVNNTYARQNIGAVVLASDGIYNRGNNPVYKTLNGHIPLFSLGMGDTTLRKDLRIKEVTHNAIAYLNNDFPVELLLTADACTGAQSVLTLSSEGKTLYSERIDISKEDYYKNVQVSIQADKPGTMHIVASLTQVNGEVSISNNRKDIFVDIIDGREKILLAYAGPHPDIGAISSAIQSNRNYEINAIPASQVSLSELAKYNVAILHQIPARGQDASKLLSELRKLNIPVWCITGNSSFIEQLSLVSPQARIDKNQGRFNETQALLNNRFNLFNLSDESRQAIQEFPPLKSPYGIYSSAGVAQVMMFQKVGAVETDIPLWFFSDINGEKTACLFGEGYWRWRLFDFLKNGNHLASNEIVNKTIQFLSLKEDKRKFRVYPLKNVFEEDETVKFTAELYNASYEPILNEEIRLSLFNAENKVYNYTFTQSGNFYQLDIGKIAPGAYRFTAKTSSQPDAVNGKLLVLPLQTELVNTRADFGLMRQIAKNNDGRFYKASELKKLLSDIKKDVRISSTTYREKKPDELINVKLVFFILLILLSAEWFLRKYEGAY